ncbi:hypothetical protein QCA50_010830 [Cerrena zonata]|uniref:Uncharacterized protein n=1 Tax=Cerrena zonata TaxID=2478898 RepID=A0AAW0G6T6_9APHY
MQTVNGHESSSDEFTIEDFFAQFSDFDFDPSQHVTLEFNRLAESRQWGKERRRAQYRQLQDALVGEFNHQYGRDEGKLAAWQALCEEVGIDPIPTTITQCRKALANVHVNLVDLVDARRRGRRGDVKVYETVQQLRKYTRKTGKYFPRQVAKAGGVLRGLLRRMS